MKKKLLFIMSVLLSLEMFCACSNINESPEISNYILGEWKLVKAIPEESGFDYVNFLSDSSYYYTSSRTGAIKYEGKYSIIKKDCEVGTVDYQTLQSNYSIRLYPYINQLNNYQEDIYVEHPFIILDDMMHLYTPFAYTYSAQMFKRIK